MSHCPVCLTPNNPKAPSIDATEDDDEDADEDADEDDDDEDADEDDDEDADGDEPIGATAWDAIVDDWVCLSCFNSNPGTSLNCLHCDKHQYVDVRSPPSRAYNDHVDDVSCGAYGHEQQLMSTGGDVDDPHTQLLASVSIDFVDNVMPVAHEALVPLNHSRIFMQVHR